MAQLVTRLGETKTSDLEDWPIARPETFVRAPAEHRGRRVLGNAAHEYDAGSWTADALVSSIRPYPFHEFVFITHGSVDLTATDGASRRFKAGQSFVIPQGAQIAWRQPERLRKHYFRCRTADVPEATVSDIQTISTPPTIPLTPVAILLPDESPAAPVESRAGDYFADPTGRFTVSYWEASPYKKHFDAWPAEELMIVLDGCVEVAASGSPAERFIAGDVFAVAQGTSLDWRIINTFQCIVARFEVPA